MDVLEDLLQRIKHILEQNGVPLVVRMKPNGEGIEKITSDHGSFNISTVAHRYQDPTVLATGLVGELWSDSVIYGPFKEDLKAYKKMVSDFSASGMQVWVNAIDGPKGQISTGLARVQFVYSFSNNISDEALSRAYIHFAQVTGHYHDFVHSNLRKIKG
jgi:hypothetical protein